MIRINKNDSWMIIIYLLLFLSALLIFFPNMYNAILPYYTYIVAVIFVIVFISKMRILDRKVITSLINVYLFLLIYLLFQGKNPLYYLTVLSSPIAFFCFDSFRISEHAERIIKYCFTVLWFGLVLLSVNYFSRYMVDSSSMVNSNVIAMFMLDYSMLLVYLNCKNANKYKRKNTVIFAVTIICLYYGFRARGCTIALVAFGVLGIIRKSLFKRKKLIIIITIIVVIVGALIPFIYISLISTGRLGVDTYETKSIFTRERVWLGVVETFRSKNEYILFGFPNQLLEQYGGALHNNSLEVLVYLGVFGLVGYFIFVIQYIKSIINRDSYDDNCYLLIASFICLLVLGFTEVSLFWAATYAVHYLFLGIASGSKRTYGGIKCLTI